MLNKKTDATSMSACIACATKLLKTLKITNELSYYICEKCGLCIKHIQHGEAQRDFEVGQAAYYDQSQEDPFAEPFAIMSERMARRASVMIRYLIPSSEVLEIGPGGGQVAEWFQGKSYRYLGCEISAPLAKKLAEKGVPVINGDFEGVDFKDNYDLILSFHTIEHITNPYAQLKKAYSVTKPGGRCIVATPNAQSWEQIIFPRNSANFDPGHLYVFSPISLKLIAEAEGWKMVSCITSEYTSDWLRIISKMVRRIRGEDETTSAGKYSRSASTGIFSRIISIIAILTSPFRGMQARLKGGNEIIMVLQKPCTH
jgi:SAM-dependent methyltransferase